MSKKSKINHFGMSQTEALAKGCTNRERLKQTVQKIASVREGEKYPHIYIFSPPGLGKTFTVKKHLEESDIQHFQISGNVSMFAFGIQLAVINYRNVEKDPVVIFVDDCDEIFKTEANCNTMKNVLDGSKVFIYEKSLASQWSHLSDIQKEAVEYFEIEGKMGFSVPCNNMVFVFASNFKLPIDDDVRIAREKSQSKSLLIVHKNAIRSRCRVCDFDISSEEEWGWIADVALNTDCLDDLQISQNDKQIIIDYLWYNWQRLTERSIRLIEKMADTMRENPNNYRAIWDMDYLKK